MIAPTLGLLLHRLTAAAPACAAINHLLAQEPWARAACSAMAARWRPSIVAPWRCVCRSRRTAICAAPEGEEARVTISLKLADVPLMLQNRERAFSYVQIAGDAEFANAISSLSNSLRWEAEHDLEKWWGQ
jgi:ubiquinone biosynthesis protein UbiJ